MTILDYVNKLGIGLTDEQKNFLTAWEKSYLKNETFVVSMPRNCGRQAILNLIHQYTGYCRGRKESVKEFADKIKLHMIRYCHGRLDQQYCAAEVIDYIGKLMGEKSFSIDVEAEMKKHDEKIRKEAGKEIGTNLLNAIFDKECGTEKHNLWLISQINHYCFGTDRICDIHAKEGEDINVPATKEGEQE